ncbi:MAG: cupin domain-containing protein [Marinovum sp.]|nr:cupin domain-containing protein [Marinovum sp.]
MSSAQIIATLGLTPHPEGGHYRQTWKATGEGRGTATAIYFLLQSQMRSHWHQVDAAELWLYHAGAPLTLYRSPDETGPATATTLGPDVLAGHAPQLIVEPDHWQAAETQGDWTLVSCIVSPGFTFDGFTLAPPDFAIPEA